MRKTILFALLFLSVRLFAQTQSVFGDSSTVWVFASCHYEFSGGVYGTATSDNWVDSIAASSGTYINDSLLKYNGSVNYCDYHRTDWSSPLNGTGFSQHYDKGIFNINFLADTVHQKGYYLFGVDTFPWYDMNLIQGDTFWLNDNYPAWYDYFIVDTVYYENGRKHISLGWAEDILCSGNWYSLEFIDGVGANFIYLSNRFYYIVYKRKDSVVDTTYNINYYNNCTANSTGLVEEAINTFSYYPNPIKPFEKLQIKAGKAVVKNVRLLNCFGQVVLDSRETELIIPALSQGIYTLLVEFDKGNTIARKLLIN